MSALRAPTPSEQESVGALVQRLGADVTQIIRAEIALFQVRLTAALRVFKGAGGGLAAALLLGLAGFGVLMAGLVMVIAILIPTWLAAFAVGGGLLLIAAILVAIELRVLTQGVHEALSPVNGTVPERELRHGQ